MIKFDYIDHISYVFKTIEDGYNFFKNFPGFRIYKGPRNNHSQGVQYLFISIEGSPNIELLAPLGEKSPINNFLKKFGPGLYHFCYACKDLDESINKLIIEFSWFLVSKPKADPAFDGRKVAFLKHKSFGLIELVESFPTTLLKSHENNKYNISNEKIKEQSNLEVFTKNYKLPLEILKLINEILEVEISSKETIKNFSDIENWDSLSMAIFHANFESMINERIDFEKSKNNLSFYIDIYKRSNPK